MSSMLHVCSRHGAACRAKVVDRSSVDLCSISFQYKAKHSWLFSKLGTNLERPSCGLHGLLLRLAFVMCRYRSGRRTGFVRGSKLPSYKPPNLQGNFARCFHSNGINKLRSILYFLAIWLALKMGTDFFSQYTTAGCVTPSDLANKC